jgi:hypothetical protein
MAYPQCRREAALANLWQLPETSHMSDQSQGAGWWKATDEKWYPPRWEYDLAHGYINPKPHLEGITELLDEMGRQGWEAVGVIGKSSSMAEHVTVLMKRPLLS